MSYCEVHTMRDFFVGVILFSLCVGMYLSQDLQKDTSTMTTASPYIESDDRSETISYDYYDAQISTENPNRCYTPNLECIKKLKTLVPICAFKKKMGLNNYYSVCEINLQNCLVRPQDDLVPYGEISKNDYIYYNNRGRDCFFYIRQSKNVNEAVKLYHAIGDQISGKRTKETLNKY